MRTYTCLITLAVLAMLGQLQSATVASAEGGHDGALNGFRLLALEGAGVRWGERVGDTPVVTYAFANEEMRFPKARNCRGLTQLQGLAERSRLDMREVRRETRAAFEMWERAARISFAEIDDPGRANIVIGAQSEPFGHAFTNVAYKAGSGPVREIEQSLICLNPAKRWKAGFDGNLSVYDVRYTMAHEIGHAIGLDHPDDNHALMSFRYKEVSRELRVGDIRGAVALYGSRSSPNVTGSVARAETAPSDSGGAGRPAPPVDLAIGQPGTPPVSP